MIKKSINKRSFISIFLVALAMLLTTAFIVIQTNTFSNFAAAPGSLITAPFQGYYNAELGLYYGKFLIENVYTSMGYPGGQQPGNQIYVPAQGSVNQLVTVDISRDLINDYTIKSTATGYAGTMQRVVSAHYDAANKVIDRFSY